MISEPYQIQTITLPEMPIDAPPEVPKPQTNIIEADETYGKFSLEPLERGYSVTLGNPLRRVLLSSMPGAAVTWVKIEGILHEYTTIPHVKEEVMELLLNIKSIRIRTMSERPTKLRLEVSGEGAVSAGDIMASSDCEIVNPELHLATLDSHEAKLSIEFNVDPGKGYKSADHADGLPIGVLPIDAIFSPVRKVNCTTERVRIGLVSNYERLIIEVWTDGTITPVEAVRKAGHELVESFFLFTNTGKEAAPGAEGPSRALDIPAEQYNTPIERLSLSSRTLNCLKRANINKVGEVLEMQPSDLLKIRNFGEKSLQELNQILKEMGFLPETTEEGEEAQESIEATEEGQEEPAVEQADLKE